MGDWVFVALVGAAVVHIFEEYVYPGGFAEARQQLLPRAAHLFTLRFQLAVNGLFVVLCLLCAWIGRANLVLSLSAFSLIFANALLHIRGAILQKRYYPGVISSALIYIPLAIYAYAGFLSAGQLTWPQAGLSVLLGAACMGLLMAYVLRRQVHANGIAGSK